MAPQHGVLVGLLGQLRHVLADSQAGQVRVDRFELASDIAGIGLHVPTVEMRLAAVEIDEDGALATALLVDGAAGFQSQQIGQSDAEAAERSGAQHITPTKTARVIAHG